MNCRETLTMLTGYMDGEIDLVYRMEIERHLQTCPECESSLHDGRTMQTALHSKRLYYAAPKELESRVLAAVRTAAEAQQSPSRRRLHPLTAIAACALALTGLWLVLVQIPRANREESLTRQVTCSHVRSLMATHLLDIASADPPVVSAWFRGKLDYPPPVVDLRTQRYPLLGARLDYLRDRPVAALVYTKGNHPINLFLWPATDDATETIQSQYRNGYRLCRWSSGTMTFWAISDLSASELAAFAKSIQDNAGYSLLPENCR